MHFRLSEEQELLREVLADLLELADDQHAAAETAALYEQRWDRLSDAGMTTLGLPEELGGTAATFGDLAVVAQVVGMTASAVPLIESLVAARLLACLGGSVAHSALETSRTTGRPVVLAIQPCVGDDFSLVPGGLDASAVIGLDGPRLVLANSFDRVAVANLGDFRLADITAVPDYRHTLATGQAAHQAFGAALDELRILRANWLVGLARAAQQIGLGYATDRHQFDVPISSFQAIQHKFADLETDIVGADLLAKKAAWSRDLEGSAGTMSIMAAWFAGDVAERVASWSLHVHGGYGFMSEYAIQRYFRSAKAARLIMGDPRDELVTLARRLWLEHSDASEGMGNNGDLRAGATSPGYDFALDSDSREFRSEVRAFLDEHLTPAIIDEAHRTGTIHNWELHRKQAEAGHIGAGWPTQFGGQGRSALEMNVLSEEMYLAGAPVDGLGIATLVAHTLIRVGSDWQKANIVPRILRGDTICCLGYTEPDAGSDVASVRTRAVRDGDHWLIDGQKMFTTMAHESEYVFLLARTNPDVAKHKGLTMFIIPMDSDGISVLPVHTMAYERTNITFYDAVRVDDRYRVGEIDDGWNVMMVALTFERNGVFYGELVRLLDHAVKWARVNRAADGVPMIEVPSVQERLSRSAIGNEVSHLLGWRAAWLSSIGELPNVEGAMAKLFTTEHYQSAATDLMNIMGVEAIRRVGDLGSGPRNAYGAIEEIYRHCQVTTIYGGTSEVQRSVIAERGLGLTRRR